VPLALVAVPQSSALVRSEKSAIRVACFWSLRAHVVLNISTHCMVADSVVKAFEDIYLEPERI